MPEENYIHLINGDIIHIDACKSIVNRYDNAVEAKERAIANVIIISIFCGIGSVFIYFNIASSTELISAIVVFLLFSFASFLCVRSIDIGGLRTQISQHDQMVNSLKKEVIYINYNIQKVYERKLDEIKARIYRKKSAMPDVTENIIKMNDTVRDLIETHYRLKSKYVLFSWSAKIESHIKYSHKRAVDINYSVDNGSRSGSRGSHETIETNRLSTKASPAEPAIPLMPVIRRDIDWVNIGARRHEIGLVGERLVLDEEVRQLTRSNRPDLARLVKNVDRDGAQHPGYDIASYSKDGCKKFIEVKTTDGELGGPFYMSANELNFLEGHLGAAFVYRVSIPDGSSEAEIAILNASTVLAAQRSVVEYRVKPKSDLSL